jgi:hypothetical protein
MNRGRFIHQKFHINAKDKRHSGRITPRLPKHPGMKYSEIISEGLEPQVFWDDWQDWRDGWRRGNYFDRTKTKINQHHCRNVNCEFCNEASINSIKINEKIKKQTDIRKARKLKWLLLYYQSGMERQKK